MKSLKMFVALFFAVILVAPNLYAAKKARIGYADLSYLFDEYHRTKDYDKILESKHKSFEAEHNIKIEKIRDSQGKLGLLTDDKKSEVEQEIESLKADLLEYDRQQKTDLTKERNEKVREILLEIEKIISDYAEKQGYELIFNDRVLIYGNPAINVTDSVLEILNAKN